MKTGIIPAPKGGDIGGHAMVIDGGKDNDEPRCKALSFVTNHTVLRQVAFTFAMQSFNLSVLL